MPAGWDSTLGGAAGRSRARAKSGDAAMISGCLGLNSRFDKAVANFALSYAEQNERDYKGLLKAIRDGRVTTFEE